MAGDDVLERSWQRAWPALAAAGDGSAVRDALLAAYREPDRHYHTLEHLRECIECLAACGDLAERPAEVEIALWFHDAVHDVHRDDNERRSAEQARAALAAAGVAADVVARIDALVMATRHATATPTATSSCWSTSTSRSSVQTRRASPNTRRGSGASTRTCRRPPRQAKRGAGVVSRPRSDLPHAAAARRPRGTRADEPRAGHRRKRRLGSRPCRS